jgi:hypothetical protein
MSSTYHKIFVLKYRAVKILWIVQYMKTGTFLPTLMLHKVLLARGRGFKF